MTEDDAQRLLFPHEGISPGHAVRVLLSVETAAYERGCAEERERTLRATEAPFALLSRDDLVQTFEWLVSMLKQTPPDSFEGRIEYTCIPPDDAPELIPPGHFMVRGAVRHGNREGQGSTLILGGLEEQASAPR